MQALKLMEFIEPERLKNINSIAGCAMLLQNKAQIDFVQTDQEFRTLKKYFKDNVITDPVEFWRKVAKAETGDGELMFPQLTKLVQFIFSLPHSSAACERIFSQVNLNKTKIRNRLETDTLEGILHSKSYLHKHQVQCFSFEPPKKMIRLHCNAMYDNVNASCSASSSV